MKTMLLSLWDDFSNWVTLGWSDTTYIIVMCVLGIFAMVNILNFLKGNKFNKDKKPFKWPSLVICLVLFAIMAVLSMARYM